jgi:hypothetical protein
MNGLKAQIKITLGLGVLSLLAGIVGHLALTDIYHLEADIKLEWNILQGCALVFGIFISAALFTLFKTLKTLPE